MVERRCTRCNRSLPLSEFDTICHPVHCSGCRNRSPVDDRRDHRNALVRARRKAARILGGRCQARYCKTSLWSSEDEAVWQLVPRTVTGRRAVAELDALSVYSLSEDVLTKHFKALCAVHYYKHVLKEEECDQPPIPPAALRRVKSKRSPAGSKKSSKGETRTSDGRETPIS